MQTSLFARYKAALARAPLRTRMVTTLGIYSIGDVLAQRLSGDLPFSAMRTAKMGCCGCFLYTPYMHNWLRVADSVVSSLVGHRSVDLP